MKNLLNNREIPVGLGMALAENLDALNYFSSLNEAQKSDIIEHTHQIRSKKEMHHFVNSYFSRT